MRRFSVIIFALALVAAACGDDSGGGTAATSATTVAAGDAHDDEAHEDDGHDDEAPTTTEAHEDGDHEEGDDHDDDEVAGLSPDNIPDAIGDVNSEYTIVLSEFAFDTALLDLTPGETVRFTLINEGVVPHEFRLTTAHKAEEHVAAGHDDHGDEGHHEGHHEDADIIVNVEAGETRIVEMTLPDDVDAIDQVACLIPGHHEAGMFTAVDF